MSRDFRELRSRHLALLEKSRSNAPRDLVVAEAQSFLEDLTEAGHEIGDIDVRERLESYATYWGSFVFENTGVYPATKLQNANVALYRTESTEVTAIHQLPSPPRDFTDREVELATLMNALKEGHTILGVQGLGGVGKTTLALKLSEQLLPQYPDAQLYVDLKGASVSPVPSSAAMAQVIRAFFPAHRSPGNDDETQALYRSVLYGKRALIFLDDAAGAGQVLPLIPPESCLLLITSRRRLTLPGIFMLNLDVLSPADANKLLATIAPRLGRQTEVIARLCGYLPLALRIAGSAFADRIDLDPSDFLERLSKDQTRLELVEASFNLSYELLSSELQHLWRTLAVFPISFEKEAAAAVWEFGPLRTQEILSIFVAFSLVEWNTTTGRYRLHDLARLFANSRLQGAERVAAQQLHATYYEKVLREIDESYREGGERITGALNRFDLEWGNIEAGQAWAKEHATENESAAKLCATYPISGAYLLELRLQSGEKIRWLEEALAASRRLEAHGIEGAILGNLGLAYADRGEPRRAIEFYEQALSIYRGVDNPSVESAIQTNLGNAYVQVGDPQRAMELYQLALRTSRSMGERRSEAKALANTAIAYYSLGELERAIELHEQALAIYREIGDRRGEGDELGNIGLAFANLGELERAIELHEQALAIYREIGDRRGEGKELLNASLILGQLNRHSEAISFAQAAVGILDAIGDPAVAKAQKTLADLGSR